MNECTKCGSENLARAESFLSVSLENPEDLDYFMRTKVYACKDCGHIEMTSRKVENK